MTPGVNKGTGLKYVADLYCVDIADTVAIGDSEYDTEIIEKAGVGVAMGNTTYDIKSVAYCVITSVVDDSIAHSFEHLGLI